MNQKHNREEVIQTGMHLFCKRGYSALGIDEICRTTGMTKGAFYNAFKSKEQFLNETILYYGQKNVERIQIQLMARNGITAIERLKLFYENMFKAQPKNNFTGCYINNIMAELAGLHPLIAQSTKNEFDQFIEAIIPTTREAQADGDLNPGIPTKILTELIHSTFYGLLTRLKSNQDFQTSIATFQLLINQLK